MRADSPALRRTVADADRAVDIQIVQTVDLVVFDQLAISARFLPLGRPPSSCRTRLAIVAGAPQRIPLRNNGNGGDRGYYEPRDLIARRSELVAGHEEVAAAYEGKRE